MAAANTDKFKKAKRRFSTTVGVGGFTTAATTLPLSSTSGLDTDTAITLVLEPGTANEEVITGVVSGSNVINCVRGKEGTSDVTHAAGAAVSMYFTETHWDDVISGILVSHNQDGSQATDSVTTTSITNNAVTTAKIADANITTAKIANANVTGAKIDFASTGAGGIWWEELGRTTLSSASDTCSVTFSARNYIKIIFNSIAVGSSIRSKITFNSDTGANYSQYIGENGGAMSGTGSLSSIYIAASTTQVGELVILDGINYASIEKQFRLTGNTKGLTGAANAPNNDRYGILKWANTSAQITTVTMTNDSTSDYASGTELIILGHN